MLQSRIRRGELDRQITFIQKIVGSNITNEDATDGWERIESDATVWAKVSQKQGREVVVADQIQATFNTLFVIDYRTDLTEEMRVSYNGKVFNIISIIEHEGSRERYLSVYADLVHKAVFSES
jgi:SPP1 family predicted phage head-tail adaptor